MRYLFWLAVGIFIYNGIYVGNYIYYKYTIYYPAKDNLKKAFQTGNKEKINQAFIELQCAYNITFNTRKNYYGECPY